jgi:hypothetical protein
VYRIAGIDLLQTPEKKFQSSLRLVGKRSSFVQGLIVVPAGQNCPADPGQLVGSGDDYHVACGPSFQSAHPLPQTGAFAFDTQDRSPRSMDEHLAQIRVASLTDAQQLGLAPTQQGRSLIMH